MATESNNLLRYYPDIANHWDYKKNPYGPEDYLPKSCHKVHWIDPSSGRESQASIASRTQQGRVGTNRIDCGLEASDVRNLQDCFPRVASRLVSSSDGSSIHAKLISPRSGKKMIWRCSKPNHPDFVSAVYTVVGAEEKSTATLGCRFCRKFAVAPGESLSDRHPEIAEEYRRAGNSVPANELTPGSRKTSAFVCRHCSYRWSTSPYQRTAMLQNCPACNGSAVTAKNNLAYLHPELMREWHPENDVEPTNIRPSSDSKVKWICSRNSEHTWSARPADRTRIGSGTGCPICALSSQVSNIQIDIFSRLSSLLPDLIYETLKHRPTACGLMGTRFIFDAILPARGIAIEYDSHYYHSKDSARERDVRKNQAAADQGYTIIRVRAGLEAIGTHDIVVGVNPDPALVAYLVHKKLMQLTESIQ